MQTGSILAVALGLMPVALAVPPPWAPAWGLSSATPSATPSVSVPPFSSVATPYSTPYSTPYVPSSFSTVPAPSGSQPCPYPSGFPLPSQAGMSVPPPFQGSGACPPWGPPPATALPPN